MWGSFGLLCFAVLCFALFCYALLCFALLFDALLCFSLLCFAMLCYALLCFAMLCYALLCYALLCFAMLCFATLFPLLCYAHLFAIFAQNQPRRPILMPFRDDFLPALPSSLRCWGSLCAGVILIYVFFDRLGIVDFGGLGGSGRPGNLPKRWGGAKPPTILEGFPAARDRPSSQTRRSPVGQKSIY